VQYFLSTVVLEPTTYKVKSIVLDFWMGIWMWSTTWIGWTSLHHWYTKRIWNLVPTVLWI